MTAPITASGGESGVRAAIQRASDATGVDFSLLIRTAQRESALNPNARAGSSSATGLFQFIDSTWLDMVRRHGGDYGLGQYASALQHGHVDAATRQQILALRNDPELSACMAGELARENAAALQSKLGRAPSASELYAAHVFGPEGAARLIQCAANGEDNAAAVFPREAAANRGLFYDASGEARSARGLLDRLSLDVGASTNFAQDAFAPPAQHAPAHGTMSPALAQALFTIALMPLLRGDDGNDTRSSDSLQGLLAYARNQSL